MAEGGWKAAVLADFGAWLDELDDDPQPTGEPAHDRAPAALAGPDLHALYSELASLRQELRLQTREQARSLRQAQEERAGQLEEARRGATRGLLMPMLEVRDALVRGLAAADLAASRRWLRMRGAQEVAAGYAMALERFDRALHGAGVRQVATVGEPFDARTMVAVQVRREGAAEDGTVVEELRAGFVGESGSVLRAAEVVVGRLAAPVAASGPSDGGENNE